MTVEKVVEQMSEAAASGRPAEVWGGGSLLETMPVPLDAARIDGALIDDVVAYEPSDLVIKVGAGMSVGTLDALLADHGQECPIDTIGAGSTVGGRVATGLGGLRQLGCGPVRDWVLGATFVTGDGQVCRAGGQTVKNVTGYDLPRLLCGSWGTLGVLVDVTLKVRPRPRWAGWFGTDAPVERWAASLYAPATVLRGPQRSWVLLEGHPKDGEEQAGAAGLNACDPPTLIHGVRVSVPTDRMQELLDVLPEEGWLAEWGAGVVHLDPAVLDPGAIRSRVEAVQGRMLHFDPSASPDHLPRLGGQSAFQQRLKAAFDPAGILAPWRFG